MNIPDFLKYGPLKYKLNFKHPSKINTQKQDTLTDKNFKKYVDTRVLELYNTTLQQIIIDAKDKRLSELTAYVANFKNHPLEYKKDLSLVNTSLNEVTEVVFTSVAKTILPTISTKLLLKELFRRIKHD